MALKVKVKKVGNKFDTLVKGIKDLNNENVQVGHFGNEKHPNSDLTYAELMAVHNNPVAHGLDWPPRPVLDILVANNRNLNDPKIKAALRKYSRLEPNPANNEMLLEELGKILAQKEKDIFGSSELAPNAPSTIAQKGRNEPLVDSSALKNKVSYKTSKSKTVKGV